MTKRYKPAVRPLLSVKFEFVDSLDAMMTQILMLHQVLETALDLGQVAEPSAAKLKERLAALDATIFDRETAE